MVYLYMDNKKHTSDTQNLKSGLFNLRFISVIFFFRNNYIQIYSFESLQ